MRLYGSAVLMASLATSSAFAFESVSDDELSGTVAQSGISIGITQPTAGIVANELYFNDADNNSSIVGHSAGIPSTIVSGYANAGNLVAWGLGVKACPDAACSAMGSEAYTVNIDATGDVDTVQANNQPAVSITLAWASSVTKLRVLFNKLSLRNAENGSGNRYGASASNSDFLQLSTGYFDLTPASGVPTLGILFGNEPLTGGNMVVLSNANFGSVNMGTVNLLDKSGGAGRNMNFGFQLENFNLTGATLDVNSSGLVMTTPNLSGLNVMMRNITVGNTATPMGSLGVLGLNVSGLTMTVTGKSS